MSTGAAVRVSRTAAAAAAQRQLRCQSVRIGSQLRTDRHASCAMPSPDGSHTIRSIRAIHSMRAASLTTPAFLDAFKLGKGHTACLHLCASPSKRSGGSCEGSSGARHIPHTVMHRRCIEPTAAQDFDERRTELTQPRESLGEPETKAPGSNLQWEVRNCLQVGGAN